MLLTCVDFRESLSRIDRCLSYDHPSTTTQFIERWTTDVCKGHVVCGAGRKVHAHVPKHTYTEVRFALSVHIHTHIHIRPLFLCVYVYVYIEQSSMSYIRTASSLPILRAGPFGRIFSSESIRKSLLSDSSLARRLCVVSIDLFNFAADPIGRLCLVVFLVTLVDHPLPEPLARVAPLGADCALGAYRP